MIVVVSGTNGAGKTYLARRIISLLPADRETRVVEVLKPGPKPKFVKIGFSCGNITVIGKYDGPTCGGCDCYSWKGAADDIEKAIVEEIGRGQKVFLEGLIVATWGIERMRRLLGHDLHVVHISTPIDDCIASVNDRRRTRAAAEGKEYTPVKEDNIRSKFGSLLKQQKARKQAGIPVILREREEAFQITKQLLGL